MLSDLLVQLLGVLTNYSITVKETKQFLRSLQAVNNAWKELTPRKWHHVAISHSYSRWGRSEIRFYFDGELSETAEISWLV
ncbi:hypothetical protein ANCDUO_09089 [Ancylostoma duodenale]|uniref:Uncharacterized protein n=1 Tax=Ancylostoma duodenale TaxID=51022 RepID=A0A0C2CUR5_9BILA|nr:hypothetical protein ANCDUO_09089 [Ancylostoma duodenale]